MPTLPSLHVLLPKGHGPLISRGFSLVELAVALIIVSMLIGMLVVPFSAQQETREWSDNEQRQDAIRDALVAYAIINGKLPCPVPLSVTDPGSAAYGIAPTTCAPSAPGDPIEGYLPWKTLAVTETDAWGTPRQSPSDSLTQLWRYRAQANFVQQAPTVNWFKDALLTPSTTGDGFKVPFGDASAVIAEFGVFDSTGKRLHALANDGEPPVAVVFSAGKNRKFDGQNADALPNTYQAGTPSSNFDDTLLWIGRPYLVSKLASAGRIK